MQPIDSPRFNRIGFWTLLQREVHRFLRLFNQTLIPPVITASLYIVIFGASLGNRIRDIENVSYMQFLIPGLIMMSVIGSAYGNTSSSLFSARFQGFIQELLLSSMSTLEIVLAIVLGGVLRAIMVAVLVAGISIALTDIPLMHPVLTAFFVISVALIFSCAGFVSALWAQDFERLSVFQTYLLTPLTYLGGVFFAVEMLPPFWQKVAMANPILYFINGLRFGFLGISDVNMALAVCIALFLAVAMFAACYRLFHIGYNIKT
jgi:ABC-2 type transport system permease protein